MRKSKILGLNLPEKNGTDTADIDVITADLESIEGAMASFDTLAEKYGYDYIESTPGGIVTHTETVKNGAPVTATRVTKEGSSGGNDIFDITITIDGKAVNERIVVGATTASMEVV